MTGVLVEDGVGQHATLALDLDAADGSQIPPWTIQSRSVSRFTARPWRSSSFSLARLGSEVGVVLADEGQDPVPELSRQPSVARPISEPRGQRLRGALLRKPGRDVGPGAWSGPEARPRAYLGQAFLNDPSDHRSRSSSSALSYTLMSDKMDYVNYVAHNPRG